MLPSVLATKSSGKKRTRIESDLSVEDSDRVDSAPDYTAVQVSSTDHEPSKPEGSALLANIQSEPETTGTDQPPKKKKKRPKKKKNLETDKFSRGERVNIRNVDRREKLKISRVERANTFVVQEAAKAQVLLTQEAGYLEPEGMEKTYEISQQELLDYVDLQTEAKVFDLSLPDLGPYKIRYSPNGTHLLLCGNKGHIAMINWNTKQLIRELHLNETCRDISFLHDKSFFAVAQKKYTYIYDKNGVEIHRLKKFVNPTIIDFLPYHFLLVGVNDGGVLRYQDTSTGREVATIFTKQGPATALRQNPYNAVMLYGNNRGVVSMWTPNMNEAVVKMLCHNGKVTSLCVDKSGHYLTTTGMDNKLKIWDVRNYKELYSYNTPRPATTVDISQRGILAIGSRDTVQMWKEVFTVRQTEPYMMHRVTGNVAEMVRFCPFEDIAGVGHSRGFSSIVIPGSGEPNFDSFAANPFQTASQRREAEVHALLDKIQPEMIQLDPTKVGMVDDDLHRRAAERKEEEAAKEEPSKPKNEHHKEQLREQKNRELRKQKEQEQEKQRRSELYRPGSALNRFNAGF